MECPRCGAHRIRYVGQMTNVDKYICRQCGKHIFLPLAVETKVKRRQEAIKERAKKARRPKPARLPKPGYSNCYAIFNHQKKGDAYARALERQGKYTQVFEADVYPNLAFVLTDSDILGRAYRLDRFRRRGCNLFFVIPHTARPNLVNDIYHPWQYTTAQFVVSQGHVDVLRAYGYERPLHPVGWTLCPIRPFTPRPEPRNVLFAPIHPRCSKVDQKVNADVFERLYKLAKKDDIILMVRFIRSLPDSGLRQVDHPNVIYTTGHMDQNYEQIDNADVVIGHQTFAWLAVARGVPTVMMAERTLETHVQPRTKPIRFVRHWQDYVDLIAYPLDILECNDTLGLLRRAVTSDEDIIDWRRRMIGNPFRPDRFLKALEKYL